MKKAIVWAAPSAEELGARGATPAPAEAPKPAPKKASKKAKE